MTPTDRPACPLCGSEYTSWTAALACETDCLDTRGQR